MEEIGTPGGTIPQIQPPNNFGQVLALPAHTDAVSSPQPPESSQSQTEFHPVPPKRRRVFLYIFIFLLAVLGFVVVSAITYGAQVFAVYRALMQVQSETESVKTALKAQKIDDAGAHLQTVSKALGDARTTLGLIGFTRTLPLVGTQFVAAQHLVTAGEAAAQAGLELLAVGEEVQKAISLDTVQDLKSLTTADREKVLGILHKATPKIDGARADLALALTALEKIPATGVVRQIKKYENQLELLIPQADNGLNIAKAVSQVGPDIAGYPQERRYLVLFLNNTELRPGGGFIGSYGILRIKNAEIVEFTVRDVYELDKRYAGKITPPAPIKKYLAPHWYLRDANWSPDFPTSAAKALEFYKKESGDAKPISGVLGITPDLIHDFLTLTGPLKVEGYPYTFTPENFNVTLENAVEYDYVKLGLTDATRKQILGDLNKTLMNRILALPKEKIPNLASVIGENVRLRHMMLYLTDTFTDRAAMNTVLSNFNWDGHILKPDGDFLMLVDANFYGLKTDPVIQRSIDYSVHFKSDGKATARAVITYQHTGFPDRFIGAYQTYARLFVPAGAKLISSKNTDSVVTTEQEDGKTSFGFFERIETQTSKVVLLEYELPQNVISQFQKGAYTLSVQKQLGGYTIPFTLTFQGPKEIGMIEAGDAAVSKVSSQQATLSLSVTSEAAFRLNF